MLARIHTFERNVVVTMLNARCAALKHVLGTLPGLGSAKKVSKMHVVARLLRVARVVSSSRELRPGEHQCGEEPQLRGCVAHAGLIEQQ